MVTTNFEIVEAEWPDDVPAPKKAILNFLAKNIPVAEIKGPKDFLVNVRRAAKSNKELSEQVELKMMNNRMYIRRRNKNNA